MPDPRNAAPEASGAPAVEDGPQHERLMHQLEAAKALGVDRSTVLRRVAAGQLQAEAVDGTPKIVRASVEAYLARQQDAAGAPA